MRFFATLLLAFAASGFALHLLSLRQDAEPSTPPAWQLAATTGVFHVIGIAALLPLLRAHALSWREGFGLFSPPWVRTGLLAAFLTIPALIAAWGVHQGCMIALEAMGYPSDAQAAVDAVLGASHAWERGLLLIFAAGTAPVFEELVFRGVLWPAFRDRGFPVVGCIAVSFLFALIHANVGALVPLWLLGIFWTWLYEKTNDLSAPILSHALFNTTNFALILFAPPEVLGPP